MPTITKPTKRIFAASSAPAASTVNAAVAPPPPAPTASACCCPACVGLECLDRTRYFSGQLLTEADLNNEQSYWLAKSRLHNRFLHGWGVVCGMQVVCSECDGWVTVKPGYAIDPCGNDIIVCSEQPFNVIKAIQACCTPTKQTANCAPLRSTPPPNCQDAIQTWCITIEYQEQPSRLVTPLKQANPKSTTCSCGGGHGGCGCGCGGHAKNGSSSNGCTCSTTTQSPSVPAGACEPTRINESFRLCVIPEPRPQIQRKPAPEPGTFAYQFALCYETLNKLVLSAPVLPANPNQNPLINQQAYQLVCNYLRSVQDAFSEAFITHCKYEAVLDNLLVPAPPAQDDGSYIPTLQGILTQITTLVHLAALDCYCTSLVPPCPPDPCDDRLILACVTVQNGKIVNICHFGGRKQVVTFPVLYYWLSMFNFDKVIASLTSFLELICCGDERQRAGAFGTNFYRKESLTTSGFSSPAMINQVMSTFLAQNLGANMMNAIVPNARAVDLRPLVGLDKETVSRSLESYKVPAHNITPVPVDADPTWTNDVVAASAQFTPAAFSVTDKLTVYTKGNLVVGFDVTDPVTDLKNQVAQLQQEVQKLTSAKPAPARETAHITSKKKR